MPPLRASETGAGPSVGICRAIARATALASRLRRRDQDCARVRIVLGLGNQVGGDPFGRPVSERTAISLGPAKKSIAQSLATSAFAAATYAFPGPTILSTFGTVEVPYASARNRVGAADPEQPIDAGFARRAQDCRVRPGAHGDDLAHAGDARGNRRHQERRRERIAPAGDVAADAIERHDALLDSHAGRRGDRPAPRDLPACDAADVSSRQSNRVTHVAWSRADAGLDLCRLDLERPRSARRSASRMPDRAGSPSRRTRATMRATRASSRRSRAGRRSSRPLTARSSVLSMMRIIGTYAVGDRDQAMSVDAGSGSRLFKTCRIRRSLTPNADTVTSRSY